LSRIFNEKINTAAIELARDDRMMRAGLKIQRAVRDTCQPRMNNTLPFPKHLDTQSVN
jgi:hypothetical protein